MNTKISTNIIKHPLNYGFGLTLKKLRVKDGKTSKDIAGELNLGWSLYRLVESGSAVLQPNKAIEIIKVFQSNIEFRPLSTLLVSLQIITEHKPQTVDEARQQIYKLAEVDEGLEKLILMLEPIWEFMRINQDLNKLSSKLEECRISDGILEFLTSNSDSISQSPQAESLRNANETWANKLVNNAPPLFLDLIGNIVIELNGYSRLIDATYLSQWELRHSGRFRRIYAVTKSINKIVETYSEFNWNFIADKNFEQLRIISLSEEKVRKDEKGWFKDLYGRIKKDKKFKQRSNLDIKDDELFQLHFVEETDERQKFEKLLIEKRTTYNTAWIYELIPQDKKHIKESYFVAFMDNRSPGINEKIDAYTSIHCSWEQTERWIEAIKGFFHQEGSESVK